MIFFTSDIHFGQQSLLATGKWKERPFNTLEEMHAEIIKRWNKKVTNGDDVYILGDIGSGDTKHARGAYRTAERAKASYCR